MKQAFYAAAATVLALCAITAAQAQRAPAPPRPANNSPGNGAPPVALHGVPITTEQAEKVLEAAKAEARRRGTYDTEAIAIVEPTGELVLFWRGTQAQYSAYEWVVGKARTSARLQRTTKVLADELLGGSLHPLAYPGAMVAGAGGVPIVVDGKLIGGIGTTGGFDQIVADVGVAALQR